MARIYSNENIAITLVFELRNLGHDVLTSIDAGRANLAIPDDQVLAFAIIEDRILLSYNRKDFFKLDKRCESGHAGMILCKFDPDFGAQAARIHSALAVLASTRNRVIRIGRATPVLF